MTNLLDIYVNYVNDRNTYIRQHGVDMNDISDYLRTTGLCHEMKHGLLIEEAADMYQEMAGGCDTEVFDEYQAKLYQMRRIEMTEWELVR